jgi:hypothetical protein
MARMVLKTAKNNRIAGSASPAPQPGHGAQRRARMETSHQRALNENRKLRVNSILYKKLKEEKFQILRAKKKSSTRIYQTAVRILDLPPEYDSEEDWAWGPGGLVGNPDEIPDFGAEAERYKKVLDRALRRLKREESGAMRGLGMALGKRKARGLAGPDDPDFDGRKSRAVAMDGGIHSSKADGMLHGEPSVAAKSEELDELDRDLLGENRGGYDEDDVGSSSDSFDEEEADDGSGG